MLLAAAFCQEDLVLVINLARHGARAPNRIFPFAKKEADNFKRPGELTPLGMRQHYLIGREFNKRYAGEGNLLKSTYHVGDVWLQSTFVERTALSCNA